jgi:predicted ATPase
MLTKLKLQNWKSYSNAELYIDPLSILVGTNASGKSNAIDALQLLNRISSGSLLTSALQGDGILSPIRGGSDWAVLRPQTNFTIQVICRLNELTDYEYELECSVKDSRCEVSSEKLNRIKYRPERDGTRKPDSIAGTLRLFWTEPCSQDSPTITAKLYNTKNGAPRQLSRANAIIYQLIGQKAQQEIMDGVSHVTMSLREIFILDPIPSHMREYKPLSDKLQSDGGNIAGVLAALPSNKKDEIESIITKYATRLPEKDIKKVYAETVGKFKSDAMLYCEENWEGQNASVIDARGMSDGTLRFLAVLTALLTRPANSLLVIEEVDNGLHPSRAKLLLEMLSNEGKQRKVDVLVTTHNPALLDAMGTEMVPFITIAHRDKSSGYSVLTLLEDIETLPKLLAEGQIGKLSSQGKIEEALNGQMKWNF